jgi:Sulfotransferase family
MVTANTGGAPAPERFEDCFEWLHTTAARETGLRDFGSSDYHAGLQVLLRAMDSDSSFSSTGREMTLMHLVSVLKARLHTEEGFRKNPSYKSAVIRPLVITGIPRSGTSALHKLLAVDPQFQGLQRWLARAPMVRPPIDEWERYPEFQVCKAETESFNKESPEFASAHEEAAHVVDECMEVLQQGFVSNMFASRFPTPTYTEWLMKTSERSSYLRYADVLRLIGLADSDKRWLLKNPGHTWHPDLLFEVFPDALVVQTHRDPAAATPSLCSVLNMLHGVTVGRENAQPERLGAVEVSKWRMAMERTMAFRARFPERFHDVYFHEFHADPLRVVAGIYDRFGMELAAPVAARMRQWLKEQPPAQKTGHRYAPETFGLTAQGIRAEFADYVRTYAL